MCNFNISELKIYAIAICAVTGGKSCENVTSSIPEETKIIAPVDRCYIVEQQVVFMWGSSYITMTSLVEHSETQPTECLFLPKKGKFYLLKLFESLSHKTFTDLNYDDLIIKGLKITKLSSNRFSMSL